MSEGSISFKEHFIALLVERDRQYAQRFDAQEKAVAAALAAAEKAVTKAEIAAEKRFDSVNEFRSALADQQSSFARKTEVDLSFSAVNAKVADALKSRDQTDGMKSTWAVVGTLIALAISVAIYLKH